ncbi:hypothetical protein BD408DRAFT_486431 [Parasitella parasitica]|nr:hypothetical protein BD408DRAFT_486431 [Parasitella parasitica]
MNDQELDILYTQQLSEELILQTRRKINQFIEAHPQSFGLDALFTVAHVGNMPEELATLYQEVCAYYNNNVIQFDHVWSWSFIWRQQLAYKNLAENYGLEQIVNASHPRARKAVKQIYLEGLDQYMQWFPWTWFSSMQFIGAGGFSAVYATLISPPYDVEPVKVSLKVVDDKILNEVFKGRGVVM